MERYNVSGMSCAACSSRVEKAVSSLPGINSCNVSLLTNSMTVEGNADSRDIIAAVEKAGYKARLEKEQEGREGKDSFSPDEETAKLKRRLTASLVFLVILMYFSMGHMMWGWPIPRFMEGNHIAMGLLQLILTAAVMVINQKFFISGFKGLIHRAPNMDTLVAIGAAAAFIYSTAALFLMTDAQLEGDISSVEGYMHEFYFESAAMILTLITVGKMLEARSKGKTTDAIRRLMSLAPEKATVIRGDREVIVPVAQVKKGDIFVLRPGERVPVDGTIVEGKSAIDESALTGESIPAEKGEGDSVSAATINTSGYLKCRAVRVGEDTTLAQIVRLVSDAAATKAPVAKIADKVSGIFVPAVMAISLLTLAVWLAAGQSMGFALARGISVLVISCPCALGLATPVAIMAGSGKGARSGILFKTAAAMEETGKIQIVALDKTGTVTKGHPEVADIVTAESVHEEQLLRLAFDLESRSEHPLAVAIVEEASRRGMEAAEVSEFEALPGRGLVAVREGRVIAGGNLQFISSKAEVTENISAEARRISSQGKTPLFFSEDGKMIGMIAVADSIKEDSHKAVEELENMGIKVVMLTGDNEAAARSIGEKAGISRVIAQVLPSEKEKVIRTLQKQGKTAMVGDGINDAPALTRADVGIAIGAGTDIAVDAADVVLMKNSLRDVPAAIRLSRSALKIIHENLFWAFIYNVVGIPLAAGVFISALGWQLNPMFAAAAMSLSSFCVVTNALRLNLVNVYDERKDHKIKIRKKRKEDKLMEKTMKIEGMMCGHCEATVKKTLEGIEGVESAEVSHEKGTAVVICSSELENEVLRQAVEEQDYRVTAIE
ncbi:MAG: heavy metal translocating P-type ATPase [Candidatus Fimisoma sp.]|nr:heavy metal translocating P-type ATPase [Bacillota bacterium]MDY4747924.1 heavy metal translocating P-type ATPase [Candidatus Fimisoma sp.]